MSMLSMFGACSKLWVSGNMNGVSTSPEIANSGKERVKRRSARWNEWARWVYSAIYGGLRQVRSGVASDKEAFGLKTWYDDIIMRSSLPIKKKMEKIENVRVSSPHRRPAVRRKHIDSHDWRGRPQGRQSLLGDPSDPLGSAPKFVETSQDQLNASCSYGYFHQSTRE